MGLQEQGSGSRAQEGRREVLSFYIHWIALLRADQPSSSFDATTVGTSFLVLIICQRQHYSSTLSTGSCPSQVAIVRKDGVHGEGSIVGFTLFVRLLLYGQGILC